MDSPPDHPLSELFKEAESRIGAMYPDVRLIEFDRDTHFDDQIAAMLEWSIPVNNPKLKQQTVISSIRFLGDHADYLAFDILMGTFPYADPGFPDNMYTRIGV